MKGCAHVYCSNCDGYCNEYISSAKKPIKAFTLSSCLYDRPLLLINTKEIFDFFYTFSKELRATTGYETMRQLPLQQGENV
jgi:hypothetical protein